MVREDTKSAKLLLRRSEELLEEQLLKPRKAEDLMQDQIRKLRIPGTLSSLQEIVRELEEQLSALEERNKELLEARSDLEILLEQYTELYESAPVCYLTLNRDGIILQVNSAGASLFEVERSLLVNQPLHRFMPDDSRAEFNDFMDKIYNNHTQETLEFELKKEGETIIAHIEARENKLGHECIAALIDITAERQEDELSRKNEQKYRIVFESMEHGIVLFGKDGKIVTANQAAKSILGLSSKEMQSWSLDELFSNNMNEDDKDLLAEAQPFVETLQSKEARKSVTIGYSSPFTTDHTWIAVTAMTVTIPDEDDVHVLISFDDITHQKNLSLYNTLTLREKEIFQLLVRGYGRTKIADYLDISPKTVDKHRENLMGKLSLYEQKELIHFSKQCEPEKP